jgi:hypothetical protein
MKYSHKLGLTTIGKYTRLFNELAACGKGLTTEQVTRWLPAHMAAAIGHGVSYMACVQENDRDKIVGVSINVMKTPEEDGCGISSYLDKELEPSMWQVARFLSMLNEGT